MNLEDTCKLSYYRQLGLLGENTSVELVQHVQSKQLFVRKTRSIYRRDVYEYLQRHPIEGLPKIAELVEDDGKLIVIERYISGENLQTVLQREKTLPKQQVRSIAEQLCRIVRKLHAQTPPIVHRDIKPSNILLSSDGRVWLLDLNAAKPDEKKQHRDTQLIGTVGYAAPEQYGFGSSCVQTDLYAIGVLISVMLTGKLPIEAELPRPWASIVRKCTQMDPRARYADAEELLQAIGRESGGGSDTNKSFLPPGFRSKKPIRLLLSAAGYFLLGWICFTLELEGYGPPVIWLYRAGFFLSFVTAILFWGDYRGVQQQLIPQKIGNPILHCVLAFLGGAVVLIAGMVLTVIAETFLSKVI